MKIRGVLVLMLLARSAVAGEVTLDRTCVELDAGDALAAADRDVAKQLIERVLERENLFVVSGACTETYALSHERVDDQYVIRLRSSAGKRRMTTPALVELAPKYQKLVRSLIEAKVHQAEAAQAEAAQAVPGEPQRASAPQVAAAEPMGEPFPTANVDESFDPSASDGPSAKRNTLYGLLGAQPLGGVAWSLGYRRNMDVASVDISLNGRSSESGGTEAGSIGVEILRNRRLAPTIIGYIGGGLSLGSMGKGEGDRYYEPNAYYTGGGLQSELTAGMQLGSARGMQFIGQLDITLPFYRLSNDEGQHDYAGAVVLSGGVGF
jgi:hypothetical protein